MALPKGTRIFTGRGQAGNWSDPANWTGGMVATAKSVVLIPTNAVLNGDFTVMQMMMLGQEAVTINGTLTTLSPGLCTNFMVCANAVATFTPTSSLNDHGGLIVGNISTGTIVAQGTPALHATLNVMSTKIGKASNGIGTVTVDGGAINNNGDFYDGMNGRGTLNVLNGGVVHVGMNFEVGTYAAATGSVRLTSGGEIEVAGHAKIGGGNPGALGGSGTLSVGAGSVFSVESWLKIASTSKLTLAGGTVTVGDAAIGTQVWAGATVSGYGTFSSSAGGFHTAGTITASGGTLVLNGNEFGMGKIDVADNSKIVLNAASIGKLAISFTGHGGTLELQHGVASAAVISGFAAGDSIVMAGVDGVAWSGSSDVLTLMQGSAVVDKLQFTGAYATNPFALAQSESGALITLSSHP